MGANVRKKLLSISLIMLFSIVVLTNIEFASSSSKPTEIEEMNYYDYSIALRQSDPTNPTQILKYELLSELDQVGEQQSVIKKSPLDVKLDILNEENYFYHIRSFYDNPYIYDYDQAKMLAIGTNCYVYVFKSLFNAMGGEASARTIAEGFRDEFENKIYPNNVLYFGDPDGGVSGLDDIDGDHHVTILLDSLDAYVAGYFNPINEYTQEYLNDHGMSSSKSNEREMVYVDWTQTAGVLSHEFQHLIHFNYDQAEFLFVDEGCAEFSKYLNDYDMTDNLTYFATNFFFKNPEDSLLYWNYYDVSPENVRTDYGGAYIFIFYIAEKYGVDAIKDLVADLDHGAASIEDAVQGQGHFLSFNEIYLNWITAVAIDDPTFAGGIYGFENLDTDIDYDAVTNDWDEFSTFPVTANNRMNRYYGIYGAKLILPPDYLLLEVTQPTSYSLGLSIAVHNASGWTITQSIESGDVEVFVSGKLIDEAYILTSIMMEPTPTLPASYATEDGLGYTEDLDYSFVPGKPIFIGSYTQNYNTGNWAYSLNNVYLEDENGTAINDTSNVDVYVRFKKEYSTTVYDSLPLSYSAGLLWYIDCSLQPFDESDYEVSIIATGSSQYGRLDIEDISVEHILAVEKPVVTMNDEVSFYVDVNASYTQLNSWYNFTTNALTMILVYDSVGTVVATFEIEFDSVTNKWESALITMDTFIGNYYLAVRFGYAGRTVLSPNSDSFTLEGEEPTTNGIAFPFWTNALLVTTILAITIIRKKKSAK